LKDEDEKEIGRITSFLIDSSGQVEEVLVENKQGRFVKYPVERLKVSKDEVFLVSPIGAKIEVLSEKFPLISKKRKVLDKLSENKVIPTEIYENLCKEFDRTLEEMKNEAQSLIEDAEKQIKAQEDHLKSLQLSRTFLEIEHEMETLSEETYQQSRISILKEIKNAQQRKLSLLKTKDKMIGIMQGEEEPQVKEVPESRAEAEPTPSEEQQAIPVRVTQG